MPRLLIGLLFLVYGVLIFALPETTVSPGDLLPGHQAYAKDCLACHSPMRGATSYRCIQCHAVAEIGIVTTTGEPLPKEEGRVRFHEELLESECVACHTDHRGSNSEMARGNFAHDLLRKNSRAECMRCHERARPLDTLHRDAGDECGTCHGTEAWTPATFEHDRYFRFDRHHPADCASCHDQSLSEYTCYSCHEHSRRGMVHEHREEGISNFEKCVECHRSGDEDEAKRRWRSRRGERSWSRARFNSHDDDDDDDDDDDHDDD